MTASNAEPSTRETYRSPRKVRRAIAAATTGTALEWYDFYIYGTAAALVFPDLFFPAESQEVALLASFATFGVGFFARPVGAAIFGHVADRHGRKLSLMLTMFIMGTASLAIGFLPTYDQIGVYAPLALVMLRLLQGIGVGGEWGGSVLIAMEQDAGGRRRGFFASWTGFGSPLGAVAATGVILAVSTVTGDGFDDTGLAAGWRWPFYISLLLVATGVYIRLKVEESPEFERTKKQQRIERQPLVQVLKRHPKEILVAAFLRAAEVGPYYIFSAFILSYGSNHLGVNRDLLLLAITVAAGLTLFTVPLMGHLSDRIGRKKIIYSGIIITVVWAFVYFGLLGTKSTVVVVIVVSLSLLPWSIQYGPQPAFIAESFSTMVRASGTGLGYQIGGAVWGGFGPLIAASLLTLNVWFIPVYLIGLCIISAVSLTFLPDRTGQPLVTGDIRTDLEPDPTKGLS